MKIKISTNCLVGVISTGHQAPEKKSAEHHKEASDEKTE
jgi:hypothetical protein